MSKLKTGTWLLIILSLLTAERAGFSQDWALSGVKQLQRIDIRELGYPQVNQIPENSSAITSLLTTSSGNIYGGGMGVFNRVAVVTGPTILVGDGKAPASAEEVMAKFDEINSLEGAKPYGQITEQMGDTLERTGYSANIKERRDETTISPFSGD